VLVIDDEPNVRQALKAVLALAKHTVELAPDGAAALALLETAEFDVIVCDLMMPDMNGRDVYERIRARHPGLEHRIVFVTGGAFVPSLETFLDSIDNPRLNKPFTIDQVHTLIRSVL